MLNTLFCKICLLVSFNLLVDDPKIYYSAQVNKDSKNSLRSLHIAPALESHKSEFHFEIAFFTLMFKFPMPHVNGMWDKITRGGTQLRLPLGFAWQTQLTW